MKDNPFALPTTEELNHDIKLMRDEIEHLENKNDELEDALSGTTIRLKNANTKIAELEQELITTQGARDRYWHKATELAQRLEGRVPFGVFWKACKFKKITCQHPHIDISGHCSKENCPLLAGKE